MDSTDHNTAPVDFDRAGIMKMIPHRDPFLMIDKVIDTRAGMSATGVKQVTGEEYFFKGHFPNRPVMPGVLIIEAMAQTAAVLVVQTVGPEIAGRMVYFLGVDEARFRNPVTPGDTMLVLVKVQRHRGMVWKFEGQARVGDKLCAEAVFAAMIMDTPP